LAPNPDAFSAAFSSDVAIDVWIPMRRLLW
jgi:hypothetical protein